jgi:hypothetical protein
MGCQCPWPELCRDDNICWLEQTREAERLQVERMRRNMTRKTAVEKTQRPTIFPRPDPPRAYRFINPDVRRKRMLGQVVNFNNGEGVVRAIVMRVQDDTRVYLAAPERGSGHYRLEKGEDDSGIPRRAPADYDAGGGGGLTWHTVDEEANE